MNYYTSFFERLVNPNDLLEVFFKENECFFKSVSQSTGFPHYDAYVTKDETLYVQFALAGYDKENFKISIDRGNLIVSHCGLKKDSETKYIHSGIKYSDFESAFTLSDKYQDSTPEAEFVDGILTIKIKALENKKSKTIQVK